MRNAIVVTLTFILALLTPLALAVPNTEVVIEHKCKDHPVIVSINNEACSEWNGIGINPCFTSREPQFCPNNAPPRRCVSEHGVRGCTASERASTGYGSGCTVAYQHCNDGATTEKCIVNINDPNFRGVSSTWARAECKQAQPGGVLTVQVKCSNTP